jgi:hypothetical protein
MGTKIRDENEERREETQTPFLEPKKEIGACLSVSDIV